MVDVPSQPPVPDLAELARLAETLFAEQFGATGPDLRVPSAPDAVPSLPVAPLVASAPSVPLVPSAPSVPLVPSVPAPPRSDHAVPGAAPPTFYFLAEGPTAAATRTRWLAAPQPAGPAGPTAPGTPNPDAHRSPTTLSHFAPEPSPLETADRPSVAAPFDVHRVRADFPILSERVAGRPLVWLDNAATTQKPRAVIDRLSSFYEHENSNIHRAAHTLAARATDAYEAARATTARFLGAASADDIVFVRGATEAINLVANAWGRRHIGPGDEIVVSHLEHHANIVPWQMLAEAVGARIRVIPVDDHGQIRLDALRSLLGDRTKLVSVAHVSNALGTIVPVADVVALAHAVGAKALIDGAQAVSHLSVDVRGLDADFYVFSGHKVFGPTGIGVLYGTPTVLGEMGPWQGGGNMIEDVTFEQTRYQPPPQLFEAGTGNIADAVGLGAALEYLDRLGLALVERYEHDLTRYALDALGGIPGLTLIGTAADKTSVLSFVLEGYETEDVGRALNHEGIAVRSGHHCAQPILRRFGLEATVRPSLALYNTCDEVDHLVSVLRRLVRRGR